MVCLTIPLLKQAVTCSAAVLTVVCPLPADMDCVQPMCAVDADCLKLPRHASSAPKCICTAFSHCKASYPFAEKDEKLFVTLFWRFVGEGEDGETVYVGSGTVQCWSSSVESVCA